MPVLMRWNRGILIVAAVAGLVGCGRGSPAYNKIRDLPYSQWDSYAATLPIEQRLDLHKEIMERSGHNPKMTIESSFSNDPDAIYKSLVKRIKGGDKSRYYLGIIYEINRNPSFKICAQSDRKIVQDYLDGIVGYPEKKESKDNFYTC